VLGYLSLVLLLHNFYTFPRACHVFSVGQFPIPTSYLQLVLAPATSSAWAAQRSDGSRRIRQVLGSGSLFTPLHFSTRLPKRSPEGAGPPAQTRGIP